MPSDAEKAAIIAAWKACPDHAALGEKAFVSFLNKYPDRAVLFSYAGAGKKGDDVAGGAGVRAHGGKVMAVFTKAMEQLQAGNKDKVMEETATLGKDHIPFKLEDSWFQDFKGVFLELATAEMNLSGDAVNGLTGLFDLVSGQITSNMH